jgi:hypothetical protein
LELGFGLILGNVIFIDVNQERRLVPLNAASTPRGSLYLQATYPALLNSEQHDFWDPRGLAVVRLEFEEKSGCPST